MACLCGHARVRHDSEQGGRCNATTTRARLCFCNSFTSEITDNRRHRLGDT